MEYQRSRRIAATPDAVFAFVTNVTNLPTYLPTIQAAQMIDGNRVRLQGEIRGDTFDDEGRIHVDHNQRGLEWRVERRSYSGWMTVTGANMDGSATEVVIHISVPPHVSDSGRPLTGENPDEPDPVEEGLEAAMDSLRNLLEGTGGKEQPAVKE